MNEPVSTLMTRRVCAVGMDDTVSQVEELLASERLTWVPVLEGGRLPIGVISAADILQFHAQRGDALAVPAWRLCTYKPILVDQATPLPEVARTMVEQGIHHVVVTNRDVVVGVVSSMDFVRRFADAR
jgi:CBS domain-containing protein